jgi:hypothetical protein
VTGGQKGCAFGESTGPVDINPNDAPHRVATENGCNRVIEIDFDVHAVHFPEILLFVYAEVPEHGCVRAPTCSCMYEHQPIRCRSY